jgi:hypothetical protein
MGFYRDGSSFSGHYGGPGLSAGDQVESGIGKLDFVNAGFSGGGIPASQKQIDQRDSQNRLPSLTGRSRVWLH